VVSWEACGKRVLGRKRVRLCCAPHVKKKEFSRIHAHGSSFLLFRATPFLTSAAISLGDFLPGPSDASFREAPSGGEKRRPSFEKEKVWIDIGGKKREKENSKSHLQRYGKRGGVLVGGKTLYSKKEP